MTKKKPEEVSGEFVAFIKRQFDLQQKLLEKTVYDIRDLRQGQLLHDKRFDEIDRSLRAISHAVDKDAVKVIDHERRINKLEFKAK
jgi:hypothetical protein